MEHRVRRKPSFVVHEPVVTKDPFLGLLLLDPAEVGLGHLLDFSLNEEMSLCFVGDRVQDSRESVLDIV